MLENGPNSPVTYNQGKFISLSCGGLGFICPNFRERQAAGERLSAAQALTELGLRLGTASATIDRMKAAGFDGSPQSGSRAEAARGILFQAGGVACPTGAPTAARSPSPAPGPARSYGEGAPGSKLVETIMDVYGVGRAEAEAMATRMLA